MKKFKLIFISAAMVLCLAFLVGTLVLPAAEPRANETAVASPRLFKRDGSLNTEFLPELDRWFSASFAFRQEAITANSALLSGVFGSSNTESVIAGREGWLYYASTLDDYWGNPTISERQALCAAITLSLAGEYASSNGAELLFVPAPNKNTIYPQYMPYYCVPTERDGSAELLFAALDGVNVNYLDLRSAFLNAGDTIYHSTDSHWNNTGAALAQYHIMNALGLDGTDYSSVYCEERTDFNGDLYEMLYPSGSSTETERYYTMAEFSSEGEPEDVYYTASCPTGEGSLYMFRDSFGNALSPFLAAEFESSVFSRATPYDIAGAVSRGAGYIVIELAERNIASLAASAPVFEAPERFCEIPEKTADIGFTASSESYEGYTRITGRYEYEGTDTGGRVFAVLGGSVYEASPVGEGGEGAYTLYLDGDIDTSSIALVLQCGGELVYTDDLKGDLE